MKEIRLAGNKVTVVDDEDYELVIQFHWNYSSSYAVSRHPETKKLVMMHRLITGCPDDKVVDHINGDGLDNRRSNLRICNRCQNQQNRKRGKQNRSGYRGVYFEECYNTKDGKKPRNKPWRAEISAYGKRYRLGYYSSAEAAARAYDKAAPKLHGEFARPNFNCL